MALSVRLLGGARKALAADSIEVDGDEATVGGILDLLASRTSGELGASNVLVAVNGADSSAVGGREAVVRAGDDVVVIPVVHGGAGAGGRVNAGDGRAARAGAGQAVPLVRASAAAAPAGGRRRTVRIEAYVVGLGGGSDSGAGLLDRLRAEFPRVALQAVAGRFVLGGSHLRRVVAVSIEAERRRTLVAKRLETDMLARLAGTAQVSAAIRSAGMGSAGGGPYVIIAVAAPAVRLAPLRARLGPLSAPAPAADALPASRARFLARRFGIAARGRAAVLARGPADPLEELLVERAASLVAA